MKFTELKESIAQGAKSVYLIEGEDAYFRIKAEEQLKAAFLTMPELNFTSFDGSTLKGSALAQIETAAQSYPFMSEKRMIKISDFYPTESDYEKYLKNTFENCPDTTIILIVNAQSKKGFELKRKKCVTYVDCSRSDPETVTKWVYLTLKRAGIYADVAACEAVASYCLCNMSRVAVEVEKLTEFAVNKKITKADVDALVYKDADYRLYEMTNAVARKNYSAYIEIVNDLTSKGMDENVVLTSLLNYFKNLLIIDSSHRSDSEIATMLKMKEYGLRKNAEQARAFGRQKLKDMVGYIYSLISDIRNGRITPSAALTAATSKIFFA